MSKEIRLAATIMLGRDNDGKFEILLLKRNKALAFAGGLWVFPGGKIEKDEIAQTNTELEAAKIAAIRETKEEANLSINQDSLIFIRHWTTPEVEPRRFATWFFFSSVQSGNSAVQIDDSEIKKHLWMNPQTALEKMSNGELGMLPPTFLNLQLVRHCKSVEEAEEKLRNIKPIFVLPVVSVEKGGYTILYKGDAGYETADENAVGARHRLIMQPKKRSIVFEYNGCDHVEPIHNGDDYFDK
jgi:8-oxo-dGTP pyrophosphatase MutT (NUDIX family)